jgi:hypothetical protein
VVRRWQRTIGAGTLLEVSFDHARGDRPQALVLEVDKGHLAWDEHGEEAGALRLWADRQTTAVLRLTGRFSRVGLTVWHAWLDDDELEGEVVRAGEGIRVEERPAEVTLRCGDDDLVARIGIRSRQPHRERASSE